MKRIFKLENLCCANCAAKMEARIAKLPAVDSCTLNFMTLRLTVHSETENWDALIDEIRAVIRKVEPGCRMVIR